MNIETLLEAAKYVELQEVTTEALTRDYEHSSITTDDVKNGSPPNIVYRRSPPLEKRSYHSSYWARTTSELPFGREDDFLELRRRPGAGTREVHNKLEKNRRAHLKECFELVKKQLPVSHEDKKASNLNILHNAIKYIQVLRRKDREYEHEMERLARDKIALQQKFANLKKELAAQWDHIDFNTLIPDSVVSDHEEVIVTSDTEETLLRRSAGYSSTSSLSSAATASASPHLPHCVGDDRNSPRSHLSPKHIPSDGPKMISFTSRLESKRTLANPNVKPAATHLQLPMLTNTSSGHIATTIVSPTIQLVASSNLRMVAGEPGEVAFSLSPGPNTNNVVSNRTMPKRIKIVTTKGGMEKKSGVTLIRRTSSEDDAISLVHGNGIRGKGQVLTIPNGAFHPGLPKNGVIYNQSHQSQGHLSSGFTHFVGPLAGSHGTIVTPVSVVSQGNQLAHIIASPSRKVVTPLSIKPLMPQYLVKQGSAMVVVSQNSTVSQTGSK